MSNYDQADFYFKRAETARINEEYQKAMELYSKVIDFCKDEKTSEKFIVPALYGQAMVFNSLGKYNNSIECCNQVLDMSPIVVDAWRLRADCYYVIEEYDKAIADYEIALELDPEHLDANHGMALTYEKKKEYRKSLKYILKCAMINTRNGDEKYNNLYWTTAGRIRIELKEYDEAVEYLLKSTSMASSYESVCWLYLGSAYRLRNSPGDLDKALEVLNKSIEIFADNKDAWLERGKVYEQMGEKIKAEADFREAKAAEDRLGAWLSESDKNSFEEDGVDEDLSWMDDARAVYDDFMEDGYLDDD